MTDRSFLGEGAYGSVRTATVTIAGCDDEVAIKWSEADPLYQAGLGGAVHGHVG